jgi:hypothetical protein
MSNPDVFQRVFLAVIDVDAPAGHLGVVYGDIANGLPVVVSVTNRPVVLLCSTESRAV